MTASVLLYTKHNPPVLQYTPLLSKLQEVNNKGMLLNKKWHFKMHVTQLKSFNTTILTTHVNRQRRALFQSTLIINWLSFKIITAPELWEQLFNNISSCKHLTALDVWQAQSETSWTDDGLVQQKNSICVRHKNMQDITSYWVWLRKCIRKPFTHLCTKASPEISSQA